MVYLLALVSFVRRSPPVILNVSRVEYRHGICRVHLNLLTEGTSVRPRLTEVALKRLRDPKPLPSGPGVPEGDPLVTVYAVPPRLWPRLKPLRFHVVSHETLTFPVRAAQFKASSALWIMFERTDARATIESGGSYPLR